MSAASCVGRALQCVSPLRIRVLLALLVLASVLLASPLLRYAALGSFSSCPAQDLLACSPQVSGKPDFALRGREVSVSAPDAAAVRGLAWRSARLDAAVAVRVSGFARGRDIGPLEKAGNEAQVLVVQKAEGRFRSAASALLLGGTKDFPFDRVIPLLPGTDEISVVVRLVRVSGRLEVADLRVEWLEERASARWLRYGLLAVWGCVLGLLALSWMNHALSRACVILAFMLVLVGVLMPGDLRSQAEHWMLASFALPPINSGFAWSDLAHVSMFFLLAMVLSLVRPDFRPLQLLFDLLLLAAATEALQLFVEGRQAGFDDIGLDFLGSLLGIGAAQMGGPLKAVLEP